MDSQVASQAAAAAIDAPEPGPVDPEVTKALEAKIEEVRTELEKKIIHFGS